MRDTRPRHHRTEDLRRQFLASCPYGIFSLRPVPRVAPFLKIGLRSLGQEHCPRFLEIGAGLVEGRGGAIGAFAGMATGIEAARPAPRILVPGNAGANRGLPVANHHSAASFTKPKKRPPQSGVLAPFNHPFG